MASLYIRYYQSLAKDSNGTPMPAVDEATFVGQEAVNIGASSTQGSAIPGKGRYAMLHAEAALHYQIGDNPTAAGATSMRMPADGTLIVGVRGGHKVAVIQD